MPGQVLHLATTKNENLKMQVAVELFHLSSDAANLSLGGVTIVCALLGVLGGGVLVLALTGIDTTLFCTFLKTLPALNDATKR